MKPFYFVLMALWGALVFYTGHVIAQHGVNLFPYFFGDIARWTWAGQFNLGFLMMLFLSASWTLWRNGLNGAGLVLGLLAFFGGAGFLLPYLAYLAWRHAGDTAAILLGNKNQTG